MGKNALPGAFNHLKCKGGDKYKDNEIGGLLWSFIVTLQTDKEKLLVTNIVY